MAVSRTGTGVSELGKSKSFKATVSEKEENELTLKRSRIASLSEERSPYLGYCGRYNRDWEIDIVSLPHNSLRKQLSHLFISTNSLGKMAVDVSTDQLKNFFGWYCRLHQFLNIMFEAEEHALYPYINKLVKNDERKIDIRLQKDTRLGTKTEILKKSIELQGTLDYEKPSKEVIEALRDAADKMGIALLRYFSIKEEILPRLIKGFGGRRRDKRTVEFSTVQYILKEPHGYSNIDILISCLEKPAVRLDFLKRNIPNIFRRKKVMKSLESENISSPDSVHRTLKDASDKYTEKYSVETFLTHYGSIQDIDTELAAETDQLPTVEEENPNGGVEAEIKKLAIE